MPDSMMAAISSVVPTGRRMKGSETFIAPLYRCAMIARWALPPAALLAGVAPVLRTILAATTGAASAGAAARAAACRRYVLAVELGDADRQAAAQPVGAVDDYTLA